MNLLQAFEPSNYPIFEKCTEFEYTYNPPGIIRIRGNVKEDTLFINSKENRWEIKYGGNIYIIDWGLGFFEKVDPTITALWRNHITDELQKKSPVTVIRKFEMGLIVLNQFSPDLSLNSLLGAFSNLYVQGNPNYIYNLRVFYRWGVLNGFKLFNSKILSILDDLPAPQKNSYASIFLKQNYVTPEQETQILMYIDSKLRAVESKSLNEFDKRSYVEIRDATILLLVFEVSPRPLQIFMSEYSDFKEIITGKVSYFSLRFRRNKNRHSSKVYTSTRSISERLGQLLKKLRTLNGKLFNRISEDNAPHFLSKRGSRENTLAISKIVSDALAEIFSVNPLHVYGATIVFRHHLGQCLADQGAPPSVIADRLGHSTEVPARAYIAATPNIAKIKTRALGENNTYTEIMSSLLTGEIIRKGDVNEDSSIVKGTVGVNYIEGIGACDVKGICPKNPIFSCYTCRKFHPFIEGPHEQVVQALKSHVITFLDSTVDIKHNRPVVQLELVIESAKAVMEACNHAK